MLSPQERPFPGPLLPGQALDPGGCSVGVSEQNSEAGHIPADDHLSPLAPPTPPPAGGGMCLVPAERPGGPALCPAWLQIGWSRA